MSKTENKNIFIKSEPPVGTDRNKAIRKFKRHQVVRKVFIVIFVLFIVIYGLVGAVGLKLVEHFLKDSPVLDVEDMRSEESSIIYDCNGDIVTEFGAYYRENIEYDECPESLVDAFLAIEDSRYFSHNGFDIPRFTSSVINTVLHHNTQGGSTFTMQLVKNTYFSIDDLEGGTERDATIEYKVQQIFLALQLETKTDKQTIFEDYVNKLNFGGQIRGVQKASEYYFNKDVSQLSLTESALLAGIVNLPNKYNPYSYLEYATERRNEVLQQMLNHGYITFDEYRLSSSIRVEDLLSGEEHLNVNNSQYAQYVDVVIQEANQLTGLDPSTNGMHIYTALNPDIQQRIESIENGNEGVPFTDDLMQTAIITLDNTNGEVVGIGGGRNYGGGALLLNRATQQYKQPGSSIKPVIEYPLAFEYLGYSLDEIVQDRPITFPAESRVLVNADGKYSGDITLTYALQLSLNIPAILTLENVTAKIGSNAIVDYMNSIGFKRVSYDDYHLSYAIGGNSFTTTVEELAGAHAAMINLGVYNEPHTIRSIELSNGNKYNPANQNVSVLSSGSAYLMDVLMNRNTDGTIPNYMDDLARGRSYPVYAKTGTSDWGSDGLQYGIPQGAMKDKWMVASTSKYTNAVWVGYDKAVAGAGTYFPTWKAYLNIPGAINNSLLDIEEAVSPDAIQGVAQPSDVEEVTYVKGTYPHMETTASGYGTKITSLVSSTGLSHVGTLSGSDYTGSPTLSYFDASLSNGILYLNWNTQNTCSGSRNISLKDGFNNITMSGACLAASPGSFPNYNARYYAELYENDTYYGTVSSTTGTYSGIPAYFNGNVKVCGYYTNSRGTSNKVCTYAGNYDLENGINISK